MSELIQEELARRVNKRREVGKKSQQEKSYYIMLKYEASGGVSDKS